MGIVHADLKSVRLIFNCAIRCIFTLIQANVFISDTGTPLLADFGLSQILSTTSIALQISTYLGGGSIRWMAVELFSSDSSEDPDMESDVRPTPETDVWALGMVIYVSINMYFYCALLC